MPNPKRKLADGRPVYSIPAILFIDDVSANTSKQWNKNYVVYMSNATLPHQDLEKQYNVHFIAASPNVAPLELLQGVCESFIDAEDEGIIAIDSLDPNHGECLLYPFVLFIAGNNLMQAELACQCGLTANKFCRTCEVGGTQLYECSDEGYLSLFSSNTIRTPELTHAHILEQYN
ncbi:hypothetical protein Clacol_007936 [Clathrus columnatus]|uniref:Uncharacterized protein n=1 Tax=Clathrus columnatus TaxID=1419009 RepID=A0AAV5AH52_9AGAM|nr:hypothetical protein Clacol_007936 [Clathrus columnatus]